MARIESNAFDSKQFSYCVDPELWIGSRQYMKVYRNFQVGFGLLLFLRLALRSLVMRVAVCTVPLMRSSLFCFVFSLRESRAATV